MFGRISQMINRLYDKQISATGLALFRITYFANLFFEILRIFNYRHLIYDKIPFVHQAEMGVTFGLIIWLTVIVFLSLGLFTKMSSVVNYVLTVVFLGASGDFAYHMHYLYTEINFLVLFLPVSRVLSIDRLLTKLKYSSSHFKYEPSKTVSSLAYLIPVMMVIGLVYFDSTLYKIVSPYWWKGYGMWLPSSMPMIADVDTSPVLNIKWLMIFLGYLTFAFEITFVFLFWKKRWRWPLFIIGMGFHIGILIEFPIPYFAIGVMTLYLLLVPVSFWSKFKWNKNNKRNLTFYYDAECPLCTRTVIVLTHFDIFRRIEFVTVQSSFGSVKELSSFSENDLYNDIHSVDSKGNVYKGYDTYRKAFASMIWTAPLSWLMYLPGISHIGKKVYSYVARNRTLEQCTDETCGYTPPVIPKKESEFKILHNLSLKELKLIGVKAGISILIFVQASVSLNALSVRKTREYGVLKGTFIDRGLTLYSASVKGFARPFMGIANHPLFMDFHYKNYNHIISVVYHNGSHTEFVPILDVMGQPDKYLQGGSYYNWIFYVNGANINNAKLSDGISRYTAFWAGSRSIPLKDLHFDIVVKKIRSYKGWEKDFMRSQMSSPWMKAGEANWVDGKFEFTVSDIEKM